MQALIWLNGRSISPIIRYDQNAAVAAVETIAQAINSPPQDATLDDQRDGHSGDAGAQRAKSLDITSTLSR